jgi:hypothetical protein
MTDSLPREGLPPAQLAPQGLGEAQSRPVLSGRRAHQAGHQELVLCPSTAHGSRSGGVGVCLWSALPVVTLHRGAGHFPRPKVGYPPLPQGACQHANRRRGYVFWTTAAGESSRRRSPCDCAIPLFPGTCNRDVLPPWRQRGGGNGQRRGRRRGQLDHCLCCYALFFSVLLHLLQNREVGEAAGPTRSLSRHCRTGRDEPGSSRNWGISALSPGRGLPRQPVVLYLAVEAGACYAEDSRCIGLVPIGVGQHCADVLSFKFLQRRWRRTRPGCSCQSWLQGAADSLLRGALHIFAPGEANKCASRGITVQGACRRPGSIPINGGHTSSPFLAALPE